MRSAAPSPKRCRDAADDAKRARLVGPPALRATEALRYSPLRQRDEEDSADRCDRLNGVVVAYSVMPAQQRQIHGLPQSGNLARDLTMTKSSFTGATTRAIPSRSRRPK